MIATGTSRIQLDGVLVVGNSPVNVAFALLCVGAVVVGGRQLRIELNSAIDVGDRPNHVAFNALEAAAVVVGVRVFRIKFDNASAIGYGSIEIACGLRGDPVSG